MVEFQEIAFGSEAYQQARILREQVLRAPLGLGLDASDLEGEDRQRHFVALREGHVCGTCILKPESAAGRVEFQVRQMAVEPSLQGQGVGQQLIEFCEAAAREEGAQRLWMAARQSVQDFYGKLGYLSVGEPFNKLGVLHCVLEKRWPENKK